MYHKHELIDSKKPALRGGFSFSVELSLLVHGFLDDPGVGVAGVAEAVAHGLRRGPVAVVAHAYLVQPLDVLDVDAGAGVGRADLAGDHYVLNGTKTWTTLGQHADWIFLLARTSTDVARRQEGISFLLVDMKTPGVTVNPIITIEGDHEVNEVHFEDVNVPVENLVGEEGKGWTYGKVLLQHERANIAAVAISKYRLRNLREQTTKPVRGATPLGEDRNFMRKVAAVEVDLRALEYTELRTLAAVQSGKAPGPESSILKVKGTEIQQAIDTLYLEAAGYYALPYVQEQYTLDSDPADWVGDVAETQTSLKYFNFRKASIYGGSNEIQKNIIAKHVLGL